MTITEKAAYLKGLAEGVSLDKSTPEGKLIAAMIDLLDDMSLTVSDLEDTVDAMGDQIDELDEALADALSDEDEDEDEDEDDEDEDDFYRVVCPSCGDEIFLSDSILDEGEMICPNCGEKLEFDLLEDDDDECECGCCHHDEEDK